MSEITITRDTGMVGVAQKVAVYLNGELVHKLSNNERVDERTISLMFNLFDGCGAVSVEFAKRVADALELDYIPSAFCIRCAYVKGMVFVVDFKQYANNREVEVLLSIMSTTAGINVGPGSFALSYIAGPPLTAVTSPDTDVAVDGN